ncbi:Uncharacterized protein TCM_006217 [Theobroma cacao]|uniref:Uncharacterized protein n=1 Tax=Theobroma cacao TaxID=3641 RepID=A0A061DYG2_THECC|nr:Uncharacterized protein TCM_006217 [Theobroma cacao]
MSCHKPRMLRRTSESSFFSFCASFASNDEYNYVLYLRSGSPAAARVPSTDGVSDSQGAKVLFWGPHTPSPDRVECEINERDC